MWFKRVLLLHCAASLAVTIATAVSSKDATVPKRPHEVHRLTFPSLERRVQSARNQTSSTEAVVPTTEDAESHSSPTSAESPRSSTGTISTVAGSLHESRPSSSPFSAPFGSVPDSTSLIFSSSNLDISTASLYSSANGRQSSQTLATVLTSFSQYTSSEQVVLSSSSETASITSSSTEQARTSSDALSSNIEPTPVSTMALETGFPSATPSLPHTSASTSTGRDSRAQSDPAFTSFSSSVNLLTSIDSGLSTISASAPSVIITVSISEISTSVSTLQPSVTTATTIEETSSSFISSPLEEISMPTSTSALSIATPSAQAPIFSSITATSVTEVQTSSSNVAAASASIAPEVIVPDSKVLSSVIATSTISDTLSTTFVSERTTGSSDETQPAPSSIIFETSTFLSGSVMQTFSSIAVDPTTTSIYHSSSWKDHPSGLTISSPTLILASTTTAEQDLAVSQGSSLSTPTFSLQPPSASSDLTVADPASHFPAPTTSSSSTTAQLPRFSSISSTSIFSSVEVLMTVSVSLFLPSSTLTPSPTYVETDATVSGISKTATTTAASAILSPSVWLGTILSSSVTTGSGLTPSLLPSETLVGSASSAKVLSSDVSQISRSTATFSATQSGTSGLSLPHSTLVRQSSGMITASEKPLTDSQTSSVPSVTLTDTAPLSTVSSSSISASTLSDISQTSSLRQPASVAAPLTTSSTKDTIPTSETANTSFAATTSSLTTSSPLHSSLPISKSSDVSSFTSLSALTSEVSMKTVLPSSIQWNTTQTTSSFSSTSEAIKPILPIVYISSTGASTLDLSTVTFSLLNSATAAAINETHIRTSRTLPVTTNSQGSVTRIPSSESLASSTILGHEAKSTWNSPLQPSSTVASGPSGSSLNTTRTIPTGWGITYSHSMLPIGTASVSATHSNATHAEALQTSSESVMVHSTTAGPFASITSSSFSGVDPATQSFTPASESSRAATTEGVGTGDTNTSASRHVSTSSPSQTAAAGGSPPLTTSQTAGVAVGATTGLLIAIVAAIFIVRRYHAAKHGKSIGTGSVYPEVAYLYDPKFSRYGGDAEVLISSTTDKPSDHASRATKGRSGHMQRHSTGTMPAIHFTNSGNPFKEAVRYPASQRYSEYARIDTTRALSAAVAGYNGATKQPSSYTKFPSDVSDPFNDHVIPSPTFAPFSPDDIRRPELKIPLNGSDGRGQYSQMGVDPHAYLNTSASMYPPVSPYGRPSTQGPSLTYNARHQTIDSDPFADPFEHDLPLHVDERNRTSDSMTVFAPSPNWLPPRTSRTSVGPKLPVRQPNGMMSARSLLSPVAAKYMHQAQEVKILRKSVASPVLVQVGRSPVVQPFSPPPAAPEPLGWDDIKRNSKKHFSDQQSVPAPLNLASPIVKKKPVPIAHTHTNPALTGAGQALLAGDGLALTIKIPHRYSKSVGLDVPRAHARTEPTHDGMSSDPVVREKRSRELRFADPALVGKEF